MKLKPIIASMMVMLSAPAFAADTQSQLDSMKAQIAKMDAVINQNQNPNIRQADWFNRITISGIMNADAFMADRASNFRTVSAGGYAGALPLGTATPSGNAQNLSLSNANIFVHALVNEWVAADVDFIYQDSNRNFVARSANASALDEGYVTIGNFAKSPIFFRAGRLYEAYGVYERYPMLTNPTQLLTETSATTAQLGFVLPQGFYGSIAALQGLPSVGNGIAYSNASSGYVNGNQNNRSRIQNGVANLGYSFNGDNNFGAKIDVGYIANMADVNYVAANLESYGRNVPAFAVSGDFRMAWFDAGLRYVGATRSFEATDILSRAGTTGARPQAYGIDLGATFPVMAHASRLGVGYQQTKDAVNVGAFGMPRDRWYADYMVNFNKWSDVGFAYYRDHDYTRNDGGTNALSNVGMLRLSIKAA